jgi:hypothetical protein
LSTVDSNDITFSKINDVFDPKSIDCTEGDNRSDSQDLQDYITNYALSDQEQNLSVTYLASSKGQVVGYCNIAITTLPFEKYPQDKPNTREEIKKYPALLIANFCTDRNTRVKGVGSEMLRYCVGLGSLLSQLVGCRYVMLYATTAETFYSEKNKTPYKFFVARVEKDGRKLMLFKLYSKKERHLTDSVSISEKLTASVGKSTDSKV